MKIQIEITAQSKMHENILAHSIQSTYALRRIQDIVRWTLTANTPIEPNSVLVEITAIDVEDGDAGITE